MQRPRSGEHPTGTQATASPWACAGCYWPSFRTLTVTSGSTAAAGKDALAGVAAGQSALNVTVLVTVPVLATWQSMVFPEE